MLTSRFTKRKNRSALTFAVALAIAQCPLLAMAAPVSAIAPVTQAATGNASAVPVRQVVLFSSGVGYFEHFGTVTGDASTELSFKRDQINDVLKSLLLEDLDKGIVTSVTYGSQGPLARTLKSFEVDITANPPLAELLNQLRGARVAIDTELHGHPAGVIIGVEKKQRPVAGDRGGIIDTWVLNLMTDDETIRPVALDELSGVKLEDPKLQKELSKALVALAQSRDQDKKPVTVHFQGKGERRVRIGYVVETPIWKTSYRLVLPEHLNHGQATTPSRPSPEAGIDTPQTQPGDSGRKAQETGKLQGWAIIENQTDNDWTDVQLSLMSGRPISFVEDLYQPLYVQRPTVEPELFASLRPQTYAEGMASAEPRDDRRQKVVAAPQAMAMLRPTTAPYYAGRSFRGMVSTDALSDESIDIAKSVSSIASAAKVGELFQYTVGNVTLPRQQSAMIPIVTDSISVKRLSIYNAAVMPRNPLLGARVTNDTGKLLPQGPLTVLDAGSYAGDANIEDLPTGQNRLISYGVDQQMLVNSTETKQEQTLLTGRIIKGVLELSTKRIFTQVYVAENKSDHAKGLLIEHPRHPGWKLIEPAQAQEATDTLYRFEAPLAAKQTGKTTVREELVEAQRFAIGPMELGLIETYSRTGEIPQQVKDALIKAAKLKGNVADAQREIDQRSQKINDITAEQNRIRENMKTVAQNSDYYQRLLKKLDQQESQIERLQDEVKTFQQRQQAAQQELEQYLENLDVGSDAPKSVETKG